MKIYGYDENDQVSSYPLSLREGTIECTRAELKKIIQFLTYIDKDLENYDLSEEEDCHYHYSDWNRSWNEKASDLIIAMLSDKTSQDR